MPLKIRGPNFIRFVLWGVVIAFLYVSFGVWKIGRSILWVARVRQSKMDLQYMMRPCIIETKYYWQKYLNRYKKKKKRRKEKKKVEMRTMTNEHIAWERNRFYTKNFSISMKNNQILVFKVAFIPSTQNIHSDKLSFGKTLLLLYKRHFTLFFFPSFSVACAPKRSRKWEIERCSNQ